MEPLFLNFPTFYHSAIKGNTNLSQFNAVSVLLLGKVREKCTDEAIDDPSVSVYVSGKKPIRKSILTPLLSVSHKEIVGRLNMLGIQDIQRMVDALTTLIGQVANLSDAAKAPLLQLAQTTGSEYDFVAETFLVALKCPAVFRRRLSDETIQYLNLLGWPEQAASMLEEPTTDEEEQVPEPEPEPETANNVADTEKQETETRIPIVFSQKAQEVFVSFRSLSIPQDKEAIISYFLSICDDSLIGIERIDIEDVISGPDESNYSLVEINGAYKSVCSELSRWKNFFNCTACVVEIEMSPEGGLEVINEIVSCVQDLVQEDATILFGAKFVADLTAQEVRVHLVPQMQRSSQNESDSGSTFRPSRVTSEEKEDADPFDDIFQIFNKQHKQVQDAPSKRSSIEKGDSSDSRQFHRVTEEEADPFDEIIKIFSKQHS